MAFFQIERASRLPVDEAWRRVTEWARHGDHAPLTSVVVTTPPPTRAGTSFVARTGVGPIAFDDPMEVVRWDPPAAGRPHGSCRVVKRGTVITGWAEIEVHPHTTPPGTASKVIWREELRMRWVPRPLDGLTAPAARLFFGRTLSALLGE
ncbi:SRPBCC family protein [Streptosporangium sp. KLBMP 9127]|nr:SRPBCC family protein [Streptosporangium sp. KLBMP 9127]